MTKRIVMADDVTGKLPQVVEDSLKSLTSTSRQASRQLSLFGGATPVASHVYRVGANLGLSNGTDLGATTGLRHKLMTDVGDVRLVFANIYNGTAGLNDISVKASIDIGGVFLPVFFRGGLRTAVITPGGFLVSDPVSLPPGVVKGTIFRTRTYVSVASAGQKWPLGMATANTDNEGVVAGSDLTDTGTIANSFSNAFGPVAILGSPTTPQPSVAIIGDSISDGQADNTYGTGTDPGYIQRALFDANLGYVPIGKPGERANQFVAAALFSRRFPVVAGVTDAIAQYGINDVNGATPLATMKSDAVSLWTAVANRKVRVWQTTITPSTTSSNTVPAVNDAIRTAFNDWIRDGSPIDATTKVPVATGASGALRAGQTGHPLSGYFEIADLAETARNSGIWKTGYSADGTHPTQTGTVVLKTGIDTSKFGLAA